MATQSRRIDALRGLAALLVLVSHADAYRLIPIHLADYPKVVMAETGVDLFFFLSGFLIWTSAERTLPNGLWGYVVNRVTRIAPLYYVALAIAIMSAPFFLGSFVPSTDPIVIARHLWFSQSLNPNVADQINPVLWTLTHEAIFYALCPLIWLARKWLWAFLPLGLAAFGVAWQEQAFVLSPFFKVAFMFAGGFTIAAYKIKPNWIMCALSAIASALTLAWGMPFHIVSPLIAFTILAGVWSLPAQIDRALFPLSCVGLISYSLYIWHYLLIEFLGPWIINNHVEIFRVHWLYTMIFLVATFGLSTLSYLMIEFPSMGPLRRWLVALPARRLHPVEG